MKCDGQTLSTSSATLWLESAFFLVPFLACRPLAAYAVRSGIMASFTTFSDAAKAAALQLEPTLEAALRKYDVHEDIIPGFRCNRIKSQAVFVALDRTVEGLTDTLKVSVWIPAKALLTSASSHSSSPHGRKARSSVKPRPRLMRWPVRTASPSHLPANLESIMKGFMQKH